MRTSIAFVVAAAVALGLTVSHSSLAGSRSGGPSASCEVWSDGTKECSGNLEGFLYSSGSSDFAEFYVDEAYAGFYASYHGGAPYMCTVNNPPAVWLQAASLPANAGFSVQISTNGACTLFLVNSSTN
jgi:hypothetical protein